MKKRIASMLAATVMLFSVIALPASAQTDWLGNSDLTTAKVREIADADTLTESQIAEINNHYSEYEIMQGISKTLIEDYAARINPDNPPHCAVCAGFDDLWLHYINDVYRRLGYDGSNYDIQRGYDYVIFQGVAGGNKTFLNERKHFQAVRRFGAQHAYKSDYYNTGAMTIRLGNVIENNGVNSVYKGFIKPQSEYPDAYTDTFYISQKLSNSTGNSILDVLNDAFSDGSSEWVGYKGGFFSYNDDACVLVTAKGMSFSESGDYSLTYVESGKTTTLTDSRGFEQEADIYYAYNTDEFSEAYENLNTVDNEIADESSLIFEFLIGNENYTDWQ